jgi:hypothetical protein
MRLVGKFRLRDVARSEGKNTSHDGSLRPAILIQIVRSIFSALQPPTGIFPSRDLFALAICRVPPKVDACGWWQYGCQA